VHFVSRDQITDRLAEVGRRRTKAMAAKREASDELATLVPLAHGEGVTIAEIVRLTGLSRQGVYFLLEDKQ
jgi:hypothetical protein